MWDKMETFYHVVKAGSFTKAEQVLNKSQSTLSRSVILLEQRLGHKLLNRHVKGLELTRKGEEVFRAAQSMFMSVKNVHADLNEKTTMPSKVRICTTDALLSYILIEPLIKFQRLYPDISLELFAEDSLTDLLQNEVDISVRPYSEEHAHIIQKHLLTLERGLYASKSYLEKRGEPKTLKDLACHDIIVRSAYIENPYADVNWILKLGREGMDPLTPILSANSTECLLEAASHGLGITSSHEEMKIKEKYGLVRVLPDLARQIVKSYLVYPRHLKLTKKIEILEEFLLAYFSELREKHNYDDPV